ncbi:hypothetical protein B0H13DRAFT_1851479 [Mycena leptocephala]|nr:hypothetical protein B0H13DRAFT_1851479 [Mycena leptocephala]
MTPLQLSKSACMAATTCALRAVNSLLVLLYTNWAWASADPKVDRVAVRIIDLRSRLVLRRSDAVSRWKGKHAAKENLILPLANAPQAMTRAQNYVKTTILDQKRRILVLQQSNSDYQSSNASLTMELDIATSRVHTLEAENTALTEEISGMQDELDDAKEVISAQSGLIKQGKQRINRLMRDKLVLSSRIACMKLEILKSVLCAQESRKLSKKAALDIEHLLQSISRLNTAQRSQKAAHADLQKDFQLTERREKRGKSIIQRLRKELLAKSKWNGTKGRIQLRAVSDRTALVSCRQSLRH